MSRPRQRSRGGRAGNRQNYTRAHHAGPAGAQGSGDRLLDRHEVERQNALQVSETAERAGAIVEGQVESIMEQAEAGAEAVRRNADQDAALVRDEATASAARVVERVEELTGSLEELAGELRREADALQTAAEAQDAAPSGGDAERRET